MLKNVRALLVAPGGTLWIASEKTRSANPFDAAGKPSGGLTAEEPRALSLTPRGEIVLAARTAVRIGPKDIRSFTTPSAKPSSPPEPVEKILAAAVTPSGSILVSDDQREKVLRFDADGKYRGPFPERDTGRRQVTRIVVDGEGGIVLLDREEKTVRVLDETGRVLRSLGPTGLRKPADVAVDPFRNTYVADEEGAVLVFNPQGQLLATLAGPELRRPRALALDATGAVLVYDERAEKVLRYR
jgi:DNA-binding beta-propeller fold protein YncE